MPDAILLGAGAMQVERRLWAVNADSADSRSPTTSLRRGAIVGKLLASLREHALLLAIVAVHMLIRAAMPALLGRELHFGVSLPLVVEKITTIGFWCFLLAGIVGFVAAAVRRREGRPLPSAWAWLSGTFLRADRIWGGIIVMGTFPVFAWNFAYLQTLLPMLHPIDWDPAFAAWDQWLHFGRAPWEWLQPLLGYPIVTSALSLIYALWFIVLYGVNAWQAFARRDPVLRMQYLLCTVLIWAVIGNIGCTIFASGGPVYYGRLTGLPDPFAPLMQYLHAGDAVWRNFSVGIQETMWGLYLVNGQNGNINGAIAAMPSLHVATACGFYLVARATNAKLGYVFGLFLALMLIGSVHLGWHYAIDGYAGIAGTVLLWYGIGCVLRWRPMHRLLWGDPANTA
jgi:PAP2 superfamily